MVTDSSPFCTTDDANVFDGKNSEEQILVGPIIPILVVHGEEVLVEMGIDAVKSR